MEKYKCQKVNMSDHQNAKVLKTSGNVNLKTVKRIAATGVERISIGSITHSASAVDFKLEI